MALFQEALLLKPAPYHLAKIAELMVEALENHDKPEVLERIRGEVKALTDAFPLY